MVPIGERYTEMKPFPEMLSVITDPALEVFQVTTDLAQTGDARGGFFTPDGKRYVFRRADPTHKPDGMYWAVCEIDNDFALVNITRPEDKPRAPFVSEDGRHLYYFQDFSAQEPPRIALRRVSLSDFTAEEVAVFDTPIDGIGRRPRAGGQPARGMTQSASLRGDGKVVCSGFNFFGDDGQDHFAPVFIDLETLAIHGFEWEPYCWRVGGAYFRGANARHREHLFMVRHWSSQHWAEDGTYTQKWYSDVHQASMHIVDEQGTTLATVPIGGKGEGVDHPMWRGGKYEIAVHSGDFISAPHWRGTIRTATPVPCAPRDYQKGRLIPGGRSIDLTRRFTRPDVCHQSWHVDGVHGVFDTEGWAGRGTDALQGPAAFLYLGTVLDEPGEDPHIITRYLLHPRSSWNSALTENCPELSPDLKHVVFNSDWTCKPGKTQLFVARGFSFPKS